MEALFGLVILFTSIDLLYIRSQAAASRDTSTLSGLAAILVVNPDVATVCAALWRSSIAAALEPRPSWWKFTALRRRLRAILPGSSGLSTPKKRPSFWNFSTAIQRTNGRQDFSMLAEEDAERYLPDSITPFLSRWKWWQPLTLRPKFRTTVLSLTAAIVAALEVLLRFSQKLNGLGIINHDNELHYAWTLPAALTMVLLKLYVHACDFGFRQLGPYHALRERTTFTRAMSYNPLNSIACNTVTKGWRRRQWSIVLASTASILAALLPVVISGLFSPELVSSQRITLLEPWWFNTSTRGNAGHNGDGMAVADLVLHNNYSMPTWTTRSLALGASQPPIEGGIATSIDPDHPDQIKVTVPSISSLLKCVKHTGVESYCRAVISERTNSGSRFYYYQLPEPLSRGGHLTNTTASCVEQWVSALSVIARDKYFGYFIESGYLYGSISSGDKQPPDQPHFVWGQNIGGDIAQITFLRCQETVHELDVEATFSIPSLELDTGTPPTPLWSTMRKSNMPVLLNRPDLLSKVPTEQSLDWFFQALVYGKYAIAVEHLGNVTSENIVTDAIKNLTSMYRAIEYSIDGRIGSNHNSIKQQSKPAVLTGEQNLRLVQNAASTHALAGLLGLISVLVATACWAMDTGQLVPTEPSSIAATASFFANLNIFDRRYLPEGSEWLSDKQMVRRGVLQGIGFGAILPAALVSRLSKKKSQSVSTPQAGERGRCVHNHCDR